MALISLDDLDELDEDQLDDDITDDITDNPQPIGGEEALLSHWRAVASTHQVSVPTEMAGPIQEMTRNHQQREPVPYTAVTTHEKLGSVQWEEREYPSGFWAVVTDREDLYEQSISTSFMKIMRFICKENSAGRYLGMTVPVVSQVRVTDGQFDKDVQTSFYLPAEFQTTPPTPSNHDITILHREPVRIIARTFYGTTNEETVSAQISQLWEILGVAVSVARSDYMVAAYENPAVPRRRNEIWFIRQ